MQQPFEKINCSMNTEKIQGLQDGILYGQNERVDELNSRILDRFHPDFPLQPNFDPRSVPTKYSHFPIIDMRTAAKESFKQYTDFSTQSNFVPLGRAGPVAGYLNKVETESMLRNQFFALQRGAGQGVYIPSSQSELYGVQVVSTKREEQPYPELFKNYNQGIHTSVNNSDPNIGNDRFNNHTRTQLRGSQVICADQM